MEDKKKRIRLFIDKNFVVKMDKEIKSAGFKSRNDFVAYAVNSYFADKLLSDENSVVNVIQSTGYVDKTYKTETDLSKGLPLLVFSMEDGNGGHRVDYGKKLNYIVHMKVKTPWGYMERSKHSSTVSLVAQ